MDKQVFLILIILVLHNFVVAFLGYFPIFFVDKFDFRCVISKFIGLFMNERIDNSGWISIHILQSNTIVFDYLLVWILFFLFLFASLVKIYLIFFE